MVNTEYCTDIIFTSDYQLIERIAQGLLRLRGLHENSYPRYQVGRLPPMGRSNDPVLAVVRKWTGLSHFGEVDYYIKVNYVFSNEFRALLGWYPTIKFALRWDDNHQVIDVGAPTASYTYIEICDDRSDNPSIRINGIRLERQPPKLEYELDDDIYENVEALTETLILHPDNEDD